MSKFDLLINTRKMFFNRNLQLKTAEIFNIVNLKVLSNNFPLIFRYRKIHIVNILKNY